MTSSILGTGLRYDITIKYPDGRVESFVEHNLLPQVAVDHIASLIRGAGATPISSWYVGIFENNYVPTNSVTAADLPGVVGESVAYSEATRPAWVDSYNGISVIDNVASKAVFTFTADKTIYGGFIVSTNTKGGNTGLLLSIARFSTPKVVPTGAEFSVSATLTLTPV